MEFPFTMQIQTILLSEIIISFTWFANSTPCDYIINMSWEREQILTGFNIINYSPR